MLGREKNAEAGIHVTLGRSDIKWQPKDMFLKETLLRKKYINKGVRTRKPAL